jgi:prolyl 4-hydroxylase
MAAGGLAKMTVVSIGAFLVGIGIPYLPSLPSPKLASFIGDFPVPDYPFAFPFLKNRTESAGNTPFVCDTMHSYRTELVSLDPLIIYIHDLITPTEIASLLETAEPRFAPSQVTKHGRQQQTSDRTSSSAGLPRDDPTVVCVLNRARNFMGTMLRDGWDEMGPPQLVRYTAGQRFNVHHDWFDYPQWAADGERKWNRVASFFAILQDNCTGGETHFPHARPIAPPSPRGEAVWQGGRQTQTRSQQQQQKEEGEEAKPLWREHEDGGLAFRPVAGNAIFWINLHNNGTGDWRTVHAGLPLEKGLKTAMNIWPRHYYPYE